jgi:acyl carrier protein
MKEIRETVRKFLLDNFMLEADPTALADDADLKESGVLDSLSALKLMSFIEDQFDVRLELEDLESGSLYSVVRIEQLVLLRAGAQH